MAQNLDGIVQIPFRLPADRGPHRLRQQGSILQGSKGYENRAKRIPARQLNGNLKSPGAFCLCRQLRSA